MKPYQNPAIVRQSQLSAVTASPLKILSISKPAT